MQVKAVFLFYFTQFVEWPPEAFSDPRTPFVIGVLGEDPFGSNLDGTVRDEVVRGRSLIVRRFRRPEEIDACHILFISRSEAGQAGSILARLKGRSILAVSDMDEFIMLGGMIRFVTEEKKVRLRIDVDAAKSAGLKISAKLLRPAEVVSRQAK